MIYSVAPYIFDKNPDMCFGIIIGKGLKNSQTTEADSRVLRESEVALRSRIQVENLKTTPAIAAYREALKNVGINCNKYMNSVEAMSRRVVKGDDLPRINALVDLCNAVALKYVVSLGAHDLRDIHGDLGIRLSVEGDQFLPIGAEDYERVPPDEVVFTSGNIVQTRQWLWRQGKLGMIHLDTSEVVFHLVGFKGDYFEAFNAAMDDIEKMAQERFGATTQRFVVDCNTPSVAF